MIFEECYTLSNGAKIPKIGLGTWFIPDESVSLKAVDHIQSYGEFSGFPVYGGKM